MGSRVNKQSYEICFFTILLDVVNVDGIKTFSRSKTDKNCTLTEYFKGTERVKLSNCLKKICEGWVKLCR